MDKTLHFIYYLPSDVSENTTYTALFEDAVRNIRRRFKEIRGDNRSFKLNSDIVEVYTSNQATSYFFTSSSNSSYASKMRGNFQTVSGYDASEADDKFVIIAHPVGGTYPSAGWGGEVELARGYAVINADLFFARLSADPDSADSYSIITTVIHEIGHLLGFDHNTDGVTTMSTTGRTSYPNNTFTASETTSLQGNEYLDYTVDPELRNFVSLNNLTSITA